jgi:hypothetical protein
MPLETQIVDIIIDGGLNQKYDARVIGPNSWIALDNVVYRQHGALEKRNGYGALTTTVFDLTGNTTLDGVYKLDVLASDLVALSAPSPAAGAIGRLPMMHTFAESGTDRWTAQGTACPLALERSPVSRAAAAIQRCHHARTDGGLLVYTWYLATLGTLYKVVDEATGAVLVDGAYVPVITPPAATGITWHQLFNTGAGVILVAHDGGGDLFAMRLIESTLTWTTPTLITGNLRTPWDACPIPGTNTFAVAYGAPNMGVDTWDAISMTQNTSVPFMTLGPEYVSIQASHTHPHIAVVIGYRTTATDNVKAITYAHNGAVVSPLVTLDSFGAGKLQAVAAGHDAAGNLLGLWTAPYGAPNWPATRARKMTQAGVPIGTQLKVQPSVRIWSKPYVHNGLAYAAVTRWIEDTVNPPEDTGLLVFCIDADGPDYPGNMNDAWPWTPVGNVAQLEATTNPITGQPAIMAVQPHPHAIPHGAYSDAHWSVPMLVLTGMPGATSIRTFTGVDLAMNAGLDHLDIKHDRLQETLWQTSVAQNGLVMTGGTTRWFDGQSCAELGFLKAPLIASHTLNGGTGNIKGPPNQNDPPYVYLYVARYEWFDEKGNLHTSAPSKILSVSVSHQDNNATVTMSVTNLHYTTKHVQRLYQGRDVRIAIFRTLHDDDAIFYRITPPSTLNYNAPSTNPISSLAPLVPLAQAITDAFSDAQVLANAWGTLILPEQGGPLDNDTPPSATFVCTHKNRLWATSIDDDKAVFYSKTFVRGEAPAFSYLQQVRLDDSVEGVTALASLDDKLAIFTTSAIYYVYGDGPADTGLGGSFSEATFLSSNAGCVNGRSVVWNDMGVFFQSATGIYLLSTSMQLTYIGEPVKLLLEEYDTIVEAVYDPKRAWVMWLVRNDASSPKSKWIVYDYQVNAWTTWSTDAMTALGSTSHTLWDDKHVWTDATNVCVETYGTPGYDPGDTWIQSRIETPWVKLASIGGYERVKHVILTTSYHSEHTLVVEMSNDFNYGIVQGQSFAIGPAAVGDPFVLDMHVKQQKATAVKVRITDVAPAVVDAAQPTGFSIAGLSLEAGVKMGRAKVPADNRR